MLLPHREKKKGLKSVHRDSHFAMGVLVDACCFYGSMTRMGSHKQ